VSLLVAGGRADGGAGYGGSGIIVECGQNACFSEEPKVRAVIVMRQERPFCIKTLPARAPRPEVYSWPGASGFCAQPVHLKERQPGQFSVRSVG
jgi:hypothetical protein